MKNAKCPLYYQEDSPEDSSSFLNKFVFDEKNVSKEKLQQLATDIDLSTVKNVHRIYLLSTSEIRTLFQSHINKAFIFTFVKEQALGIYFHDTGEILIHLNAFSAYPVQDRNFQLILTILHEIRHAAQLCSEHPLYEKYLYTIEDPEDEECLEKYIEEIEQDADFFATQQMGELLSLNKNINGLVSWKQKDL